MNKKRILILFIITMIVLCNNFNVLSSSINQKLDTCEYNSSWAVLISVGEPKRDLKNIEDLKELLLDNGWIEENIFIYVEDEATKEAILNTPQMLVDKGLKEEDLVLFYFSTHGGKTEDVEPFDEPDNIDEFIIPYKLDNQNFSKNILDDELALAFECINSDKIALIFEACYSGGMIDGSSDLKKAGRVIITSTDVNETSYPIFLRKTWLFPFYLIKGLNGPADINKNGEVSAEEAFVYAKKRTIIRSTIYGFFLYIFHKSLFIQHPQIYDGWPSEGNNLEELKLIDIKKDNGLVGI